MTDHQHVGSKSSNINIKNDGVLKPSKKKGDKNTPPRFTNFKGEPVE